MKTIIITFIASFIILTSLQGQWEIVNEGGYFRQIEFVNDHVGWMNTSGKLLKTEDGGETWISIPVETDLRINQIDFINEQIGWYSATYYDAGERHTIISKSYDGGLTWTIQLNRVGGQCSKLSAINDSVVYVAGTSYILKTTDGGISWKDQTPDYSDFSVMSVWPFNNTNLLVGLININYDIDLRYRYSIWTTLDGGDTWKEKKVPEFDYISDIQFINDSTGYFLARTSLYKTSDTLNTWTLLFDSDSLSFETFHAFNNTTIWGAIRNKNKGLFDLSENIVKSTDGGLTWEKKQTMWWAIDNVFFTESGIGFMTECPERSGGTNLYKSTDQGDTWKMKKMGQPLTDIYFINENDGLAGSGYINYGHGHTEPFGNLLITNDGGKSWRQSFTFPNDNISSCMFVNDEVGFVLSLNPMWRGYIYKTVDGGYNWSSVYEENYDSTGYEFTGNEIGFKSEEIGWAIGSGIWGDDSSGAAILGTYNSGENWDLVWKYPDTEMYSYSLNSIHATSTSAWAVGESGMIVKYTDQDQWQLQSPVTDLPLNDVFFSDEQTSWIAGGFSSDDEGFHTILLKTEDGGESWFEIENVNYLINDFYFINNQEGWAVGEDSVGKGVILKTIDGGYNWTIEVDSLSAPLNTIRFKDGYAWAVGYKGLILNSDYRKFWISEANMDNSPYVTPEEDTVYISSMISNPSNCALEIFSIIKSQDGVIHDTITMNYQGDDLWRGYWPVIQGERFYTVDLLLTQTDTTDVSDTYLVDPRFTTSGPLVVQDVFFSSHDTIPNPADSLYLSLRIKNEGVSNTITNILVKLTVLDSYASIDSDWKTFMDIPPGGFSNSGEWKLTISEDCSYGINIPVKVDIASNGYVYWNDTISVFVERPSDIDEEDISLPRIYPNPARDIVNIELPVSLLGQTVIELYNMTGIVIYRKEYNNSKANSVEKIEISGIPSGTYFVKIRQEQNVMVEKIIVF